MSNEIKRIFTGTVGGIVHHEDENHASSLHLNIREGADRTSNIATSQDRPGHFSANTAFLPYDIVKDVLPGDEIELTLIVRPGTRRRGAK